jgi:hypothetical protein
MKKIVWLLVLIGSQASLALAGPNAGGVLVVHSASVAYTTDLPSYNGLSGVACGQDGPAPPFEPECPPYDPYAGQIPCIPTAANPTSPVPDGSAQVWYVLAAFAETGCPRLQAVAFGVEYDESQVTIVASGPAGAEGVITFTPESDWEDGSEWPTSGSAVTESYTTTRTSLLQELYWFAGYAYGPATFATAETYLPQQPTTFADDSIPPQLDTPAGLGVLGFRGVIGWNPVPNPGLPPSPIERTGWGQVKQHYR